MTSPPEPRGDVIGAWRVDSSGSAWPILTLSGVIMTLGVLGIGTAFVSHGPFANKDVLVVLGAACMLAGPLISIVVLRQMLLEDEYVAALGRGVLLSLGGTERFVRWRDIAAITWRADEAAIAIAPREGEAIVIAKSFALIKSDELAKKLDDLRRKAEFDLLG